MTVLRSRWRTAAIGVESVRVTDIQTAYDELYVYTMGVRTSFFSTSWTLTWRKRPLLTMPQ